jgi:hypothetical protein
MPEVPLSSPNYHPSWVPDFNNAESFKRIPWFSDDFSAGFSMRLARVALDQHSIKRIHVAGKIIDTIERRIAIPGLARSSICFRPCVT